MLERRTYPLLAVVLTAALVSVSVWRMSGGCPEPPYCLPLEAPTPSYILVDANNVTQPYDLSQLNSSDLHSLIDLQNFTFHMNDPVCNASNPPFFVVLIHSAPGNELNRRAIRSTWGKDLHLVFLLGETDSLKTQQSLDRENRVHHDLVQGSFLDSYRNLTYKHVSGLKWATYHCPGATYVLKTDDDVFLNTPFFTEFLNRELSPLGARRLILCEVLSKAMVKRSYRSKWRVSPREYPGWFYPDYCTGWAILYSPDTVFRLYKEAQKSEYFWIDDVHVTGTLLNRINYSHTNAGNLAISTQEQIEMIDNGDLQPEDFLFMLLPPTYFHTIWERVKSHFEAKSYPSSQPWTRSWASR